MRSANNVITSRQARAAAGFRASTLRRLWGAALLWAAAAFGIAAVEEPRFVFGTARLDNGYYRNSYNRHSNTTSGVNRDASLPRGACNQCHISHGTPSTYDFALFDTLSNNTLCTSCHSGTFGWERAWTGNSDYTGSAHGSSTLLYDPASGAGSGRQVKLCVQCHNPHGNGDATNGFYASLQHRLEQKTCFSNNSAETAGTGCHGNVAGYRPTGAPNLYDVFTRTYTHTLTLGDGSATRRHGANNDSGSAVTEPQTVNSGAFSGTRRHAECVDCHNPHRALAGAHTSPGSAPAPALRGAWGVEPTFVSAWTAPTSFTSRTFDGTAGQKESWLCYKCHSYFAYGASPPVGQTDIARDFNPLNASYHPVEALITANGNINSYTITTATNGNIETMELPWQTGGTHKRMTCTDCHYSSVSGDPRGPHGSNVQYILRTTTAADLGTAAASNALCLACHKAAVYSAAEPGGAGTERGSRFDKQSTGDGTGCHGGHVNGGRATCRDCHAGRFVASPAGGKGTETVTAGAMHGMNIAGRRAFMSGIKIMSYSWANNSGAASCTPQCHATQTVGGASPW